MIKFGSRITQHMGIVSLSTLKEWELQFEFPSIFNQKIFESRVSELLEGDDRSKILYFYKPEAYFSPTYCYELAQRILDLSDAGFDVTLESDCISLLNYFGQQIEIGKVSKEGFKVSLEAEKDGKPCFLDLYYDDEGILNGEGDYNFPIGYFN